MKPETRSLPAADLVVCREMAVKLDEYLKSDALFWQMDMPLPDGNHLCYLTIGNFLERARRLQAVSLNLVQQAALDEMLCWFRYVRSANAQQYLGQATHELHWLLDHWSFFLKSCFERPYLGSKYYVDHVHSRLQIELLLEDELVDRTERNKFEHRLSTLDGQLRAHWTKGQFVWDSSLAPAFPRKPYWWLYGCYKQINSGLVLLKRLIHLNQ